MKKLLARAAAILLYSALLPAQTGRGVITGTVTDNTSAAIPAVAVTATNTATGVRSETVSNGSGVYSILNLPSGTYSLNFRKEGMRPFERQGITVSVGETIRLDLTMQVGAVTESVTVTGEASRLRTESSDLGTGIDHRTILDLPLPIDGGRQLEAFAYAITPGVEGNAWTSYINGGPAFSKEVLLDGTSLTVQIGGDVEATSPSLEAIEEFKIETSGMPAEYGRTGGGVFVFALKSGTNQFHGSAVGFMRNEFLNANSWNNNFLAASNPDQADQYKRARNRQWTYAFSAGGPIIRNRTFVFGAFERFTRTDYSLGGLSSTVPTAAFLSGDFSALLNTGAGPLGTDASGNPIYPGAILDPLTGNVFPNNVIPQSRVSTVSQKIVDIYKSGYQPAVPSLTYNNALPLSIQPSFHTEQFSVKLDHNFSERNKAAASYITTSQPRLLVDSGGVWNIRDPTGGPLSRARNQDVYTNSARFSHTFMFTPSLLNVVNFTWGMYHNGSLATAAGGDWLAKLGLGSGTGNFPDIDFGPAVNGAFESPIGYGSSGYYVSNSFILNDSLSWTKGRHTFKFGFEGRLLQMNSHSPGAFTQSYAFTNNQTGVPFEPWSNQVGFGFASFLLGAVNNAAVSIPVDLYGRRKYFAAYVQDDFKVSQKLTLNLGLRWEATTPLTEKYGRWANFEYNLTNTQLGIPGALAFANDGHTSFMRKRDWKEFAPRLGAAYRLNDRLVARASYGIMYLPIGLNFWQGVPYGFAPGYTGVDQVNATPDLSPVFYWDQGYPGQLIPGTKDPNFVQYGMVRIDPRALFTGYLHQWNAGVEFQITKSTVLAANYVGNRGQRLQSDQFERNQPDAAAVTRLLSSGNEGAWVYDEASAAAVGVPYPYPGFANSAWVAISPYPQIAQTYGPLFVLGVPKGRSSFKALQLTLSRRGVRGLTTETSYMLSRSRGNASNAFEENWWNGVIQDVTKLDREANTLTPLDITHIFKGYVSYELPFGKGRPLLPDRSRFVNALVGGWSASLIFGYQSGRPLAVRSNNWYQVWGSTIYANIDPNGDFSRKFDGGGFNAADPGAPGNRYFSPAPFSNPPYGEFGTGPYFPEKLRTFGVKTENVSLLKNFWIGERVRMQFRAEFSNILNRHFFNDPVTDINSPNFGQVTSVTGLPRNGQLGIRVDW